MPITPKTFTEGTIPMPSSRLQRLQALARNTLSLARDRAARTLLAPAVALLCTPALAALPNVHKPSEAIGGGTVADGDWLGYFGAYFKAGLTILGLVLAAVGLVYVVAGALAKWRAYSAGKADISDLKEYFIMGAIFAVMLVMLVTQALEVLK
ncbi:DUF2976 domain-containing protein [Acidovorax sp. SUPP1855]|nr:DUF2976 domain-containing protein [Acidovorax sp. SUPP1855]